MKQIFNMARSVKLSISLTLCFSSLSYAQEIPANAPPTNWNDTYVGYSFGDNFYFPGSADSVAMNIGEVHTAGGFKYGTYLFNADYNISDAADPEAGSGGQKGAQEVYTVGHVEWSASKIFGHPMGSGFIRDFGFTTGFELSSKNDAYNSAARMLTLGPTVDFAVPGVWTLTVGARKEDNYNGITQKDIEYNAAAHLESFWMIPFHIGSVPAVFKGFASITGPKGPDGFGVETITETLIQTSLLFDVGSFAGHPRAVYIGPGYQYWRNMYGTDPDNGSPFPTPGTRRSAPMFVSEFHF